MVYVNLRGWRSLDDKIEQFAGTDDARCRLLVGMQKLPKNELHNSDRVVDVINELNLPRYGLGIFEIEKLMRTPTEREQQILDGLSRAGRRLMGFCRTNLFRRLESSGFAFLQSLDRHILRNYVYLHAINHGLDILIGTQDAELLDTRNADEDSDSLVSTEFEIEVEGNSSSDVEEESRTSEMDYLDRAATVYKLYESKYKKRFKWIRANLFKPELKTALLTDAQALIKVLNLCPEWKSEQDRNPELKKIVESLDNVSYSTRSHLSVMAKLFIVRVWRN